MEPITLFISSRSYRTLSNFSALNDHIITEIAWVVTMAPAVSSGGILLTCNVTVATVKTIVIVVFLPYQSTQNSS